MAISIGRPGYETGRRGLVVYGLLLVLLLSEAILIPWSLGGMTKAWQYAFVAVLSVGFIIWRRRELVELPAAVRAGHNWIRGGRGEALVGKVLTSLPDDYVVFHDIHLPDEAGGHTRRNIDHVVLAPRGIFVIETKNLRKKHIASSQVSMTTRANVEQAVSNALGLKDQFLRWSGGTLQAVWVHAVVVYAQDPEWIDQFNDGAASVIPLRRLQKELAYGGRPALAWDARFRGARALYATLDEELRRTFRPEFERLEQVVRDSQCVDLGTAAPSLCPECGAELVRKVAHRGSRAGKAFLSCSRYPYCRYASNIAE